tara:strand:- start:3953 stop:4198 length:246 start_codon:yes stop_codon:yes gene_type:complete
MFNPLAKDPNSLSDDQLQETISGLQKKYLIASRTPNQSVLFQLQNSLTMYSEEQRKRSSDKLREQQSKDDGNNLGELINVQ